MERLEKRYAGQEVEIKEKLQLGVLAAWLSREDHPDLFCFKRYANNLMGYEVPMITKRGKYANGDTEVLIDMVLTRALERMLKQKEEIKKLRTLDEMHQTEGRERQERIRLNLIRLIEETEEIPQLEAPISE